MIASKLINFASNKLKHNKILSHKLDSELLLSKVLKKKKRGIINKFESKNK